MSPKKHGTPTPVAADDVSPGRILSLALPALGVLAAMPLYLLWDTAVVGRLSAHALASLGAAAAVQSVVSTQLTFLSYGTTARSARLFGAGKKDAAVEEGVQATWIALGVGLVLMSLMLVFAPWIAQAMTGDDLVAADTARWLRVASPAIVFTLVEMAGNGWLRGIQDVRAPLYYTLAGLIPGAIAVPIFVNHWGMMGSALATDLGMGIIAALFFARLVREHTGGWRPQGHIMREQLTLGRDLIVRSLAFQVSGLAATAVAARAGTASLAGHQVMLQIWSLLTLLLDSLAIAAQTIVGAALGAGHIDKARTAGNKITSYSVAFAVALAALFAAGHTFIPSLIAPDREVLDALAGPWWIFVALIVVGGVVFALDGVLLGAADAAFLRTITIGSVLIGYLPLLLLAHVTHSGLLGVWIGMAAFIGLRAILVVYRFRSMRWAK